MNRQVTGIVQNGVPKIWQIFQVSQGNTLDDNLIFNLLIWLWLQHTCTTDIHYSSQNAKRQRDYWKMCSRNLQLQSSKTNVLQHLIHLCFKTPESNNEVLSRTLKKFAATRRDNLALWFRCAGPRTDLKLEGHIWTSWMDSLSLMSTVDLDESSRDAQLWRSVGGVTETGINPETVCFLATIITAILNTAITVFFFQWNAVTIYFDGFWCQTIFNIRNQGLFLWS